VLAVSDTTSSPARTRVQADNRSTAPDRRSAQGSSLVTLTQQALDYARRSRSEATIRAYRSDWSDFERWCSSREVGSLPASPETLCEYLADGAEQLRPSTLGRRLAAIALAHDSAGVNSPTRHAAVRAVMSGIRRTHGAGVDQKQALRTDEVRTLAGACTENTAGTRDRALLLLGFAAGLRRSELVALDVDDLELVPEGLVVTITRSKTDQEGHGRLVAVPRRGVPGGPVVMHIGAGSSEKRWPMPMWRALHQQFTTLIPGKVIRIIAGEVEEDRLVASERAMFTAMGGTFLTGLDQLASELEHASGFIGGDSGPTHVAGAMGIPTLALFGPTNPDDWAPIGPQVHILSPASPRGMAWLRPDEVASQAAALLA